jgi:hypothetical protein
MDGDGDFAVAWISSESTLSGGASLYARLFKGSGMPATQELRVEYVEPRQPSPRQPSVAMDAQGNFIVAWQQQSPNPDGSGIGQNIFARRFAGPDDTRAGCAGYLATHAGTFRDEAINGSGGDDVIQARAGDDVVMGGAGDDIICGGHGNDQLFGEEGSDRLFGGADDDVLDGGAGSDFCDRQTHVNADTVVDCEEIEISIDIQPPDPRNVVDLVDPGSRVRAALLSDAAFDATQVDIATVRFGPGRAAATAHWTRDVDQDGVGDLVVMFKTIETGIGCSVPEASLTAQTYTGLGVRGTDRLRTECTQAP